MEAGKEADLTNLDTLSRKQIQELASQYGLRANAKVPRVSPLFLTMEDPNNHFEA